MRPSPRRTARDGRARDRVPLGRRFTQPYGWPPAQSLCCPSRAVLLCRSRRMSKEVPVLMCLVVELGKADDSVSHDGIEPGEEFAGAGGEGDHGACPQRVIAVKRRSHVLLEPCDFLVEEADMSLDGALPIAAGLLGIDASYGNIGLLERPERWPLPGLATTTGARSLRTSCQTVYQACSRPLFSASATYKCQCRCYSDFSSVSVAASGSAGASSVSARVSSALGATEIAPSLCLSASPSVAWAPPRLGPILRGATRF